MYCKCDILQTNQSIYIQIWQVSLLCCSAIHYAFLADFDPRSSPSIESGRGFGVLESAHIFEIPPRYIIIDMTFNSDV